MKKEKYVRAEIQIIEFEVEDVIITSDPIPPELGGDDTEILL